VERTPVDPKTFKTETGDYDQVKLINAFNDANAPLTIKPSKPIPADAVTPPHRAWIRTSACQTR